jgi:hypothetical protein
VSLAVALPANGRAAGLLRVALIGSGDFPTELRGALPASAGFECVGIGQIGTAEVAVFFRGPGVTGVAETKAIEMFLHSRSGVVVIGATAEAWRAVPDFVPQMLGAVPGQAFAGGAGMSVINLFPHPILAGVTRFETAVPMAAYMKLADDAQMIMEGTVGEATTPLGWVRRGAAGRLCHLVPAEPAVLADAAYRRIIVNAVRWAAGRPIPEAKPAVQRTFMPEAHPGSIALTFPNGPGVCLDPVRGGINYLWDGDFVDLRPRWITKQGAPARIFGEVFYTEKAPQPLRVGSPAAESKFRFRGYVLKDGVPEFHYDVDGRDVFETITAQADGQGVVRTFRVGPGARPVWMSFEPQAGAEVTTRGLERDGAAGSFAAPAGGEFVIEIRRKTGGVLR